MEQKFTGFRESERSLKHVACGCSGKVLVSYTRDSRFEYSNPFFQHILFLSLNSLDSVKTFRENSILFSFKIHNLYLLLSGRAQK